jgi:hypothetical protein
MIKHVRIDQSDIRTQALLAQRKRQHPERRDWVSRSTDRALSTGAVANVGFGKRTQRVREWHPDAPTGPSSAERELDTDSIRPATLDIIVRDIPNIRVEVEVSAERRQVLTAEPNELHTVLLCCPIGLWDKRDEPSRVSHHWLPV